MHHEYCSEVENLCHFSCCIFETRRSLFSLSIQVHTKETFHPFFKISPTPSLFIPTSVVVNLEKFGESYILMSKVTILKKEVSLFYFLCLGTSGFPSHPVLIGTLDENAEPAF